MSFRADFSPRGICLFVRDSTNPGRPILSPVFGETGMHNAPTGMTARRAAFVRAVGRQPAVIVPLKPLGAGITGCGKTPFRAASYQGTTSFVSISLLFLSSLADFSRRGICFPTFSAPSSAGATVSAARQSTGLATIWPDFDSYRLSAAVRCKRKSRPDIGRHGLKSPMRG